MSIKVRYFASLKDYVGRSEDELLISTPVCAGAVWQRLNPNRVLPDNVLVAINMDYKSLDTEVCDGDELAFFPPVTGG